MMPTFTILTEFFEVGDALVAMPVHACARSENQGAWAGNPVIPQTSLLLQQTRSQFLIDLACNQEIVRHIRAASDVEQRLGSIA